jgi:hypothetical protein
MSLRNFVFALCCAAILALPSRAALLISEVLFNEVGSDTTGEWIEIFNTSASPIDLTNYKIGDEEASGATSLTEAMVQFPAGASIGPYGVQIMAISATRFFDVYGFLPTYEVNDTDATVPNMLPYPSWDPDGGVVNMGNTNDQALILGPDDSIVDAVSWGSSTFAFDPPLGSALDGQSYERINNFVDTDTADDWRPVGDSSIPAAQRSTPGTVPVVIPEPGSLVTALIALSALLFGYRQRA